MRACLNDYRYASLNEAGVTCITISKRLTLENFHATELALGVANPNGWELRQLSQQQQ